MFKAFCLDSHNLLPKLLPESFKSIDFVEGDCVALGCIKLVTFTEGQGCKYSKYRIDGVDVDNFYLKHTNFENNMFGGTIEYVVTEAKYEVSANGGSICKLTTAIHNEGDAVVDEEKVHMGFVKKLKMSRAVEEYLIVPHCQPTSLCLTNPVILGGKRRFLYLCCDNKKQPLVLGFVILILASGYYSIQKW